MLPTLSHPRDAVVVDSTDMVPEENQLWSE
jgi:hypothetical protein